MRQPFKFLNSNKLHLRADFFGPQKPQHPYVKENVGTHEMRYNGEKIYPGSQNWMDADKQVRDHFDNRIGLEDMANAYHLKNSPAQKVNLYNQPGGFYSSPGIRVDYNGEAPYKEGELPPSYDSRPRFHYSLKHKKNNSDNPDALGNIADGLPSVSWYSMDNNTDNNQMFPQTLKNIMPLYQKAGIGGITTTAVSSRPSQRRHSGDGMNGAHTWANLGFDFNNEDQRLDTQQNVAHLLNEHVGLPYAEATEKAKTATHPFELRNLLKSYPQTRKNEKEHWHDAVGGAFHGILRTNSQDKGNQHAMNLINGLLRPKNNAMSKPVNEQSIQPELPFGK